MLTLSLFTVEDSRLEEHISSLSDLVAKFLGEKQDDLNNLVDNHGKKIILTKGKIRAWLRLGLLH